MAWSTTGTTGDLVQWREDSTNQNVLLPPGQQPNKDLSNPTLTNKDATPRRFDSDIGEGELKKKRVEQGYKVIHDGKTIKEYQGTKPKTETLTLTQLQQRKDQARISQQEYIKTKQEILSERNRRATSTASRLRFTSPEQARAAGYGVSTYTPITPRSVQESLYTKQGYGLSSNLGGGFTATRGDESIIINEPITSKQRGETLYRQGYAVSSQKKGGIRAQKGTETIYNVKGNELNVRGTPSESTIFNPRETGKLGTGERLTGSALTIRNLGKRYQDVESTVSSKTTGRLNYLQPAGFKESGRYVSESGESPKFARFAYGFEEKVKEQVRERPVSTALYALPGAGFKLLQSTVKGAKAARTFNVLALTGTGVYAGGKVLEFSRADNQQQRGEIAAKTGFEVGVFTLGYNLAGGGVKAVAVLRAKYRANKFQKKHVDPFFEKIKDPDFQYTRQKFVEIRGIGESPAKLSRNLKGNILTDRDIRFLNTNPLRRGEIGEGPVKGTEFRQPYDVGFVGPGGRQTSLNPIPGTTLLRQNKPIIEKLPTPVEPVRRPESQKSLLDYPTISRDQLRSRVPVTTNKVYRVLRNVFRSPLAIIGSVATAGYGRGRLITETQPSRNRVSIEREPLSRRSRRQSSPSKEVATTTTTRGLLLRSGTDLEIISSGQSNSNNLFIPSVRPDVRLTPQSDFRTGQFPRTGQDFRLQGLTSLGGGGGLPLPALSPTPRRPPSDTFTPEPPRRGGFLLPPFPALPKGGPTRNTKPSKGIVDFENEKVASIQATVFDITGPFPKFLTGLEVRPLRRRR